MRKLLIRRFCHRGIAWQTSFVLSLSSWASVQAEQGNVVNELSQNAIQSAFQMLRRDYIRHEELSFEELNRAALQGLLDRLSFGAQLEWHEATSPDDKDHEPQATVAVLSEFIAPGVAYLRPESFAEGESTRFVSALKEVIEKGAKHLILDLRAGGEGSFDEAGQMLQCFMAEGQVMFKMRQVGSETAELFVSKGTPLWSDEVVILVDMATGNAAEALAVALQRRGKVKLIGEKTRGATVRYARLPLDEKISLRYANAEMLLPDDSSIFKKGVNPDFVVRMPREDTERVLEQSRGKSIKPFVQDRPRPRYNEAALVHGGNPELDEYIKHSRGKSDNRPKPQLRDRVLQRAVDLLTAQDFYSQTKLAWKEVPSPQNNAAQKE